MVRYKFIVVLCVFFSLFLGSATLLYAITGTHLGSGHWGGGRFNSPPDPCAGRQIGDTCTGGAIYAGTGYSWQPRARYMVTPGGCTDENCSGAGGADIVAKAWANNSGSGTTAYGVNTGATDLNSGKLNTAILVTYPPHYTDTDAAHWCTNMNYGGYTDWFLPSYNEIYYVIYKNRAAIAGLQMMGPYWSSTEISSAGAWVMMLNLGFQMFGDKSANGYLVRCVRIY